MGICVACFDRDIAGALGLHRAAVVQYMRPEIIGFVLGALIAAYLFKEFRPRVGSAPIVRFVLGIFAMIGELAFLADEDAPHPFYTRGFILHEGNLVPDLTNRSYLHENAARYLLVKGEQDYIADKDGIIAVVDNPNEPALEPIGGTGDALTGIVSALIESGMETSKAAVIAARVNRLAGTYTMPTPATQIADIIGKIPRALDLVLNAAELIDTVKNSQ